MPLPGPAPGEAPTDAAGERPRRSVCTTSRSNRALFGEMIPLLCTGLAPPPRTGVPPPRGSRNEPTTSRDSSEQLPAVRGRGVSSPPPALLVRPLAATSSDRSRAAPTLSAWIVSLWLMASSYSCVAAARARSASARRSSDAWAARPSASALHRFARSKSSARIARCLASAAEPASEAMAWIARPAGKPRSASALSPEAGRRTVSRSSRMSATNCRSARPRHPPCSVLAVRCRAASASASTDAAPVRSCWTSVTCADAACSASTGPSARGPASTPQADSPPAEWHRCPRAIGVPEGSAVAAQPDVEPAPASPAVSTAGRLITRRVRVRPRVGAGSQLPPAGAATDRCFAPGDVLFEGPGPDTCSEARGGSVVGRCAPRMRAAAAGWMGALVCAQRSVNGAVVGGCEWGREWGCEWGVNWVVNGAVNWVVNGAMNGVVNGAVNWVVNGAVNGVVNGAVNWVVNGAVNGVVNGTVNWAVNGTVNWVVNGAVNGAVNGVVNGA
eukprot:scaffold12224_cov98-Isochrysis_galbana.AAC.2